ncbi:MAG: SGNH/GDSL hydrolase family protein, partial [Mycobacteriales bacterium]
AQGLAADARVRPYVTPPPPVRESYGDASDRPLTLAVLGDSSAQGVGVDDFDHTLGGWLGQRLAETGRYVRVVCAAENGSRAEHLDDQVTQVLAAHPDLVAISTGVNDVRNRTSPWRAARTLGAAVARLRAAGATVAVGTTPYLGILTLVDQPLRAIGHGSSLLLEREQIRAVTAAGGTPVALGRLLSPLFAADRSLFASDGFHPSQRGYALIGEHMLPALLSEM